MRKIALSGKTEPMSLLIASALAPSWPIGFSTMMREREVASPSAPSRLAIGQNRSGPVAR